MIQRVEAYNLQLTTPLTIPECVTIGKSIAKWTYQRFNKDNWDGWVKKTHSSEIQSLRGKRSKRGVSLNSERTIKPWEKLGISRRTYYYKKSEGKI